MNIFQWSKEVEDFKFSVSRPINIYESHEKGGTFDFD